MKKVHWGKVYIIFEIIKEMTSRQPYHCPKCARCSACGNKKHDGQSRATDIDTSGIQVGNYSIRRDEDNHKWILSRKGLRVNNIHELKTLYDSTLYTFMPELYTLSKGKYVLKEMFHMLDETVFPTVISVK